MIELGVPKKLEMIWGVVIACYYGAQKYDKLRQSVATTLVIGLGLSISVMFLGHLFLNIVKTEYS